MSARTGKTMFVGPITSAQMFDEMLAKVTMGNLEARPPAPVPNKNQAKADGISTSARRIIEEATAERTAKSERLRAARLGLSDLDDSS